MNFSKDDTLVIKGVSILFMLTHHNFRTVEMFKDYTVNFAPFSQNFIVDLALFFKICVSLFVFVSSYGLMISFKKVYEKKENNSGKYAEQWVISRLVSVLSGYWFIVILSNVICQLINQRTTDVYFSGNFSKGVMAVIINFFGLSQLFGTKQLNGTWWYMSAAVMIIIFVPIIFYAFKKFGYVFTIILCIGLPRIIGIKHTGTDFQSYIFLVVIGMIIAEYNIFGKLKELQIVKNIYLSKLIKFCVLVVLICISYKVYLQLPMNEFWEVKLGLIPVLIIYFCYEFIAGIPIVGMVLKFIGKHSMNIFLVHTFIRAYYLPDFTYSFQHFALIILVLLLVSIGLSIIIDFIKKIIKYDLFIERLKGFLLEKSELLRN